ncbi:MAG: nucleoside phosphorylase [Anaerolineaceae bacterium]|nr:nucleoside phosphorylase [Anaerolineaceae bacterium]
MEKKEYPIVEFDPTRKAIIEARRYGTKEDVPEKVILCFFHEVLARLEEQGVLQRIGHLTGEMGPLPIFRLEHDGDSYTVMNPYVGAPIAAGIMEELIGHGGRIFVACGGCGALDREVTVGHLIIPNSAVRDEGVSYKYLPPSREVEADPRGLEALEEVLQERHLPYIFVKTWTTSSFFRETEAACALRVAEGCKVVEMEAAAFFAVAKFRNVPFGQLLYGGDLVVPEGWDGRAWNQRPSHREDVFWLSVAACKRLEEKARK